MYFLSWKHKKSIRSDYDGGKVLAFKFLVAEKFQFYVEIYTPAMQGMKFFSSPKWNSMPMGAFGPMNVTKLWRTLCLKFELTLKKMLRRFWRHQNLNFEISYWFSKYFWNWTTSSWENSVFAKIYLITNQTFKDIGTLKKCSRTFDGISKIVWS